MLNNSAAAIPLSFRVAAVFLISFKVSASSVVVVVVSVAVGVVVVVVAVVVVVVLVGMVVVVFVLGIREATRLHLSLPSCPYHGMKRRGSILSLYGRSSPYGGVGQKGE